MPRKNPGKNQKRWKKADLIEWLKPKNVLEEGRKYTVAQVSSHSVDIAKFFSHIFFPVMGNYYTSDSGHRKIYGREDHGAIWGEMSQIAPLPPGAEPYVYIHSVLPTFKLFLRKGSVEKQQIYSH